MLTSIHILLTYNCNYECDHCFLFCSPRAKGTFTISQIRNLYDQAEELGTIESLYFEGGEPFLFYPLMVKSIEMADERGFSTGIVSNCYWAVDVEDAGLWLEPLARANVKDLSLSDDVFHHGEQEVTPGKIAAKAAAGLGMNPRTICIEKPSSQAACDEKGEPVVGGRVLFKGRAVDTMTKDLPTRPAKEYNECSHERLVDPGRVHVDPFGFVHLCQGICIGNLFKTPLKQIMENYDPLNHPICGPLEKGGPYELAKTYGVRLEPGYVDECHLCFETRRSLLEKFPDELAPGQVYGV